LRSNSIDSESFNNAAGVMTVQQNNGNNNVIGAAMGLIANIFDGDSSHSNAVGSNSINAVVQENKARGGSGHRSNSLDNAFTSAQGVMALQQNTGDNNVMLTSTRVVGTDETINPFGPASSMTELNTTVTGNMATAGGNENLSEYVNKTSNVANGGGGTFIIQQNTGSNTGMGSAISLVVNGPAISFSKTN
jgi:hypothetical protein